MNRSNGKTYRMSLGRFTLPRDYPGGTQATVLHLAYTREYWPSALWILMESEYMSLIRKISTDDFEKRFMLGTDRLVTVQSRRRVTIPQNLLEFGQFHGSEKFIWNRRDEGLLLVRFERWLVQTAMPTSKEG